MIARFNQYIPHIITIETEGPSAM